MSCKAKLRPDIKASIEFSFENIPRYFYYGYIDQITDELINECKECSENVNKAEAEGEKK